MMHFSVKFLNLDPEPRLIRVYLCRFVVELNCYRLADLRHDRRALLKLTIRCDAKRFVCSPGFSRNSA